ncbi:MAG: MraY family glycosyltransferase [Phycisphaeraceae bacterium]
MGAVQNQLLAQRTLPTLGEWSVLVLPHLYVFVLALLVTLVLTPVMRHLALKNGVVDWPDLKRKSHARPVAYLGGVAIFLGWFTGVSLGYFPCAHWLDPTGLGASASFPFWMIIGAAVITVTGLFDDVYGISPRVKTGGQFIAAAALASETVGLHLAETSVRLLELNLPYGAVYMLGTAVIAVFVLGGCNSLNLIDGLDGLAAGVTAIAALGFLVMAILLAAQEGANAPFQSARIVMSLAILGAVLGFLPYNFNPASIFMGDAGSLLLGFLCISNVLLFAEAGNQGVLLVAAALIVFALPITDTSLAIFRRKMRGQPIFSPDNGHLHHLLRRSGLSVKQSVGVLYGLGAFFAALGCLLVALDLPWPWVLATAAGVYALIIVGAYRYGHHIEAVERRRLEQSAKASPGPAAADEVAASSAPEARTS